jgi:hypothetical protein
MNEQMLFEDNVKQAFQPKDLATATTGIRISAAKGERITFLLSLGDSVGAGTLALNLKQHNAASGGTTKALSVISKIYKKIGPAATVFTESEPTVASDVISLADFAADEGLVAVEVLPEQFDTNGGFGYFSVDLTVAGAAKIGGGVYIVSESNYRPAYADSI